MTLTIAVCSIHTKYASCALYVLEMYNKTAYLLNSIFAYQRDWIAQVTLGHGWNECINQRGRSGHTLTPVWVLHMVRVL